MESLKCARKAKGLSLAQLADLTGLHAVSLARAERPGKDVKASTVVTIAKAVGIPVCELLVEGANHERHRAKRKANR